LLHDVAGHNIWVVEKGEADTARLFIHCSLAHHETLMPLAAKLSPASDVFFDLPGHGRSAAWAGTDYHSDATAIAAALLRGPAHIIGHSFGATVALRLAAERPDLVSRVTLIEPVMFAATIGTAAHAAHQVATEPFVAALDVNDRTAATQIFLDMWGNGRAWGDLSDRKRATLTAQINLIPAAASTIEHDIHGVLERLGDITCPVDLIEGGDSQAIMPAIMSGLAELTPRAHRHIIAGAGHMVPLTHVDEVASVIKGREKRIHTVKANGPIAHQTAHHSFVVVPV